MFALFLLKECHSKTRSSKSVQANECAKLQALNSCTSIVHVPELMMRTVKVGDLNSSSTSETTRTEKMVKRVKVGVLNSSSTSETTRIKPFADKEGAIDNKTPCLLKLLTVLCVGQAILVITTAAVLGVFVNANVSLSLLYNKIMCVIIVCL